MNDPDFKKLEEMLTGLMESKTPPGKQQIVDVTKQAMASVRHFKHVVHAVEKFIVKCKPSHKLHGFYMIDSIVRQSQKKFKHKDVFKPRFSANLKQTLENALRCPPKERPKIVRVINLWRANNIFDEDLLRSLLQYCRASGLSIDVESVEKAVKGDKADMSRYKSMNKENSATAKPGLSSASQVSKSASNSQLVPEALLMKNLSTISSDYPKAFTENPQVFSQIQSFIGEKVKQKLEAESKNKIKNILSAGFDYSDEEDYDEDENKASQPDAYSKDKVEKVTESIMKESGVQSELRKIFLQQVGLGDGRNGREESKDRKRRRSDSRDRKDSKKDRHRRSRERSHKRRSSTPRHREDKKEKERKKLGWPLQPKKEHFLISSRTIWLGRLPVNCSENEIKSALADFGVPEKIEVINSRACAYVTMPDRRSAYKILDKMAKKLEISRKPVKVNWCIGQGLHENKKLNVFWEADYGYHQIPWTELPDPIDAIFDGSYADVDTLPSRLQGLYDEKGKKKPKIADKHQNVNPPMPNQIPVPMIPNDNSGIPGNIQMPNTIPGFPPGIMPGINLPGNMPDSQDGSGQNNPNLEMLMAAVANSSNAAAQAGILGAPPQLNPALLNTLNAFNVNRFPRHDAPPLPDQQAAFQQFRGNAPRFRGNSDFGPGFGGQRPFSPRPRGNFNGTPQTRFNMPDLNKPPPSIADLSGQPLRFGGPTNGAATGGAPSLMSLNPNFAPLPPTFDASVPPPSLPHESSDEPMDIASPEQPPGV